MNQRRILEIIILALASVLLLSCDNRKTSQPVNSTESNTTNLSSNEKAANNKSNVRTVEHEINIDSEPTEGGTLSYYTTDGKLIRYKVTFYGETGKLEHMFSVTDAKLQSYQRTYWEYNRPIYWGKEKAKENNDTEYFDLEKSKKAIDLFSIKDGKIDWLQKSGKNDINQDEIMDFGSRYLAIVQSDMRKQ